MVLMPIPDTDFDPTETSVPWNFLSSNGIAIAAATPSGNPGKADERMLTGKGLGIFKNILKARSDALANYTRMIAHEQFAKPYSYTELNPDNFSALLLPGGHAPGMKSYLESSLLQKIVVSFFAAKKPVAAICHGVLLVARSIDPKTGKSVLFDYKTTSLLKSQEMSAYFMTRLFVGSYYRTYPQAVEDEVRSHLSNPSNYLRGNISLSRDSEDNLRPGFIVRDRNYLSARWPGDVYSFSKAFLEMLQK
jgi:putative intracellular protease/amidase